MSINNLALTATQTSTAQGAFPNHYSLANGVHGFNTLFNVSWLDFADAVNQIIEDMGIAPEKLILQFFHRYDPSTNTWFLTMGGAEKADFSVKKVDGNDLYNVTPGTLRFDLLQDTVTPSDFTGTFDVPYRNNFYYKVPTSDYICLNTDVSHTVYVNSISMPWTAEIQRVLTDNGVDPYTKDVQLVFSSVTFDYAQPSQFFNVQFPHVICAYLNVDGDDYLDDTIYPNQLFKMKAADMGTGCPPYTCQYIWPASLSLACQGQDA